MGINALNEFYDYRRLYTAYVNRPFYNKNILRKAFTISASKRYRISPIIYNVTELSFSSTSTISSLYLDRIYRIT
jgi:hypothetical protein